MTRCRLKSLTTLRKRSRRNRSQPIVNNVRDVEPHRGRRPSPDTMNGNIQPVPKFHPVHRSAFQKQTCWHQAVQGHQLCAVPSWMFFPAVSTVPTYYIFASQPISESGRLLETTL